MPLQFSNLLGLQIKLCLPTGHQVSHLVQLQPNLYHDLLAGLQVSVILLHLELQVGLCPLHFLQLRLELTMLGLLFGPLRLQLSYALLHAVYLPVQLLKLVVLLPSFTLHLLSTFLCCTWWVVCDLMKNKYAEKWLASPCWISNPYVYFMCEKTYQTIKSKLTLAKKKIISWLKNFATQNHRLSLNLNIEPR